LAASRSVFAARRHAVGFPLALGLAAIAAGFATATLQTARIAHPVLQFPVSSVALSGFVEIREERERSDRIVIRVQRIDAKRGAELPDRVRIAVRKNTAPLVGSFVELKAHRSPPLAPLGPAVTILRATCISSASVHPAMRWGASRPSRRQSRPVYGCAMRRFSTACAK
jgi:competence protein ComEC